MSSVEAKMYNIASHLNELNSAGKVKGFQGNEKGYAKIHQIKIGCSIWVHHLIDDRLTIDLLISPNAQKKHSEKCKKSKEIFNSFFTEKAISTTWEHATSLNNEHERVYVEISKNSDKEIFEIIKEMKAKFLAT